MSQGRKDIRLAFIGFGLTSLGLILYSQLDAFVRSSIVVLSTVVCMSFAVTLVGMALLLGSCIVWSFQATSLQLLLAIIVLVFVTTILGRTVNVHGKTAILVVIVPIVGLGAAWLLITLPFRLITNGQ